MSRITYAHFLCCMLVCVMSLTALPADAQLRLENIPPPGDPDQTVYWEVYTCKNDQGTCKVTIAVTIDANGVCTIKVPALIDRALDKDDQGKNKIGKIQWRVQGPPGKHVRFATAGGLQLTEGKDDMDDGANSENDTVHTRQFKSTKTRTLLLYDVHLQYDGQGQNKCEKGPAIVNRG